VSLLITSQQGERLVTGASRISRRQVLTIATGVAGASITGATAVIGTSASAQAAKVSQKIVKYQDTPKGEQRCENCELFEPPSSCKNVDGTVAAQGWCTVYRKKQA
jgi:High potential iron-sulfur protein